jgi:hypothetical protein
MIKGMTRLMTGVDLAKMLLALVLGLGVGAIVSAVVQQGTGRTCAVCVIGAAMIAVILQSSLSVLRRYRQLSAGKCPNPLCHGVVQRSELVGRGHVVCPTCKKTWPELERMRFRATVRS